MIFSLFLNRKRFFYFRKRGWVMERIKIALLGLGSVGSGVWSILREGRQELESNTGVELEIAGVLVQNPDKSRSARVPEALLTTDFEEIIGNSEIAVVVELIGGIEPAREYVLRALKNGKHVVTANKALIALHGAELQRQADAAGVFLRYEASVCGGIPIVSALNEGLSAEKITGITGIINGTTNYILSRMSLGGLTYEEALEEAQAKGYAEADPTADVEGFDALHKLRILTRLAYGADIPEKAVQREGITGITPADIEYAESQGYRIKLLAVSRRVKGQLELRVTPAMIPASHGLAKVEDSFNAVALQGEAAGELTFTGRGAGDMPTGSAVVADIAWILRSHCRGRKPEAPAKRHRPELGAVTESTPTPWYLRMDLNTPRGQAHRVLRLMTESGVKVMELKEQTDSAGNQTFLIRTGCARERDVRQAVETFQTIHRSVRSLNLIRIEPMPGYPPVIH